LSWNGTEQKSTLNTDYCFAISSLIIDDVTATPISIEFELDASALVLEYSSISVANNVMFETEDLLVVVDLRDQWNNSIASPVDVIDQDGSLVGKTDIGLRYNATLRRGQFVSTMTLYLGKSNNSSPHITFYGMPGCIFLHDMLTLLIIHSCISKLDVWSFGIHDGIDSCVHSLSIGTISQI